MDHYYYELLLLLLSLLWIIIMDYYYCYRNVYNIIDSHVDSCRSWRGMDRLELMMRQITEAELATMFQIKGKKEKEIRARISPFNKYYLFIIPRE